MHPSYEMTRAQWTDLLSGVQKLVPAIAGGDPNATQAATQVLQAGMVAGTFALSVDGTTVAEITITG